MDNSNRDIARIGGSSPEVDFAIVLSRVITAVQADPAELRRAIYDLARIRLDQEGSQTKSPIDPSEMTRLSSALETAIERVEALAVRQDHLEALKSLERLIADSGAGGQVPRSAAGDYPLIDVTPGERNAYPLLANDRRHQRLAQRLPRIASSVKSLHRIPAGRALLLVVVVATSLLTLIKFDVIRLQMTAKDGAKDLMVDRARAPTGSVDNSREVSSPIETANLAPQRNSLGFPLPTNFGVFAVSDGKLHELEPLPGRAPDRRVFMSAMITKPSRTTIPDGRVSFLAYRRDLVAAAPSRVSVRVVARIVRATSFSPAGTVATVPVIDAWAIRNVEHEMRVSPVTENPEMLLIKPESTEFSFSPGRYAIVLNGAAYDFVVAGDVTETAHCLERTVASNGVFYSECRRGTN